jgi:hypothetical protein
MLLPLDIFYGHLVYFLVICDTYFFLFWYVVARIIWQPWPDMKREKFSAKNHYVALQSRKLQLERRLGFFPEKMARQRNSRAEKNPGLPD